MRFLGLNITRREKRSSIKDPDDKIRAALGGGPLLSGVSVSEDTALNIATVYACVRILAESVAQLPLKVYRKTATGSEEATDHPAFRLLKAEPNGWQTSFELREMLQGHVALRGNAYALIERNAYAEPVALVPLDPSQMRVVKAGGSVVYIYKGTPLQRFQVLHIKGLTSDGLQGLSPVALLRETMGLAKALEQTTASLMGNGVNPGGVLEHPGALSDEAAKRLSEQFNALYAGSSKTGRTLVLEEEMKWHQIGMTFEDAQVLQSKKFSVEEICRIYRIPLHMVQSTEKSTSWGTGIEQMTLGFLQFTIQPWLTRWEQTMDAVLLREDEKGELFTKFDLRSILRGDHKTRMEGYAIGLMNGIYSINDVLRMEDMNELPDAIGGTHRVPLNTAPAGQKTGKPVPAGTGTADGNDEEDNA